MKKCTHPPRARPLLLPILLILMRISPAMAQGGPPMLTDDSDTPGDGKLENNFALSFEGSSRDFILAFPYFDLNYGLGEHIQLKLEMPWVKELGDNLANRFDNITFGVKYRLLDEDSDGVSLSCYPQPIISFNPEDHSKSTEFGITFPVAASKQILTTGVNIQVGYQILGSLSQWIYGIVFDHELGKSFLLLGELHGNFRRRAGSGVKAGDEVFFRSGTFVNFGLQVRPWKSCFVNLAVGKDVDSAPISSPEAKYYSYLGVQFNL